MERPCWPKIGLYWLNYNHVNWPDTNHYWPTTGLLGLKNNHAKVGSRNYWSQTLLPELQQKQSTAVLPSQIEFLRNMQPSQEQRSVGDGSQDCWSQATLPRLRTGNRAGPDGAETTGMRRLHGLCCREFAEKCAGTQTVLAPAAQFPKRTEAEDVKLLVGRHELGATSARRKRPDPRDLLKTP